MSLESSRNTDTDTDRVMRVQTLEISTTSDNSLRSNKNKNNSSKYDDYDDGEDRIYVAMRYAISFRGLVRLALILAQLAAWISALLILKSPMGGLGGLFVLPEDLKAVRFAFLAFSVSGFIVAILIYVFFVLNLNNVRPFANIPQLWFACLVIATDVIWLIPMLVLSIFCVVRVVEYQKLAQTQLQILQLLNSLVFYLFIDIGAFISTVVFGFVSTVLYGASAALHIVAIIRRDFIPTTSKSSLSSSSNSKFKF